MKTLSFVGTFLLCLITSCQSGANSKRLIDYVDPLIGTAPSTTISAIEHGEGTELFANTYPAIGVPYGNAHFTPQTRATERKCLSTYYYADSLMQGFRVSRWLDGSCTQDYGSVTIMPIQGELKWKESERASLFNHTTEKVSPAYYGVRLDSYGIFAEISGLSRSFISRFTFENKGDAHLIIQPNSDEGQGFIEIDTDKQEVRGYNPVHRIYQGWGQSAGFSGYFVVKFSKPFTAYGTMNESTAYDGRAIMANEPFVGAYITFPIDVNEQLTATIGVSFTSIEGARANLEKEMNHFAFEQVVAQSETVWEKELSKVFIKTDNEDDKQIFYTAMYHNSLVPRIFNDFDGKHPQFSTGKIVQTEGKDYYCEFSMWDIYRATLPLHSILDPARCEEWAQSMVEKYKAGGWLPIFPLWNSYTSAMIGDHITAFMGDLIMKDITGFDVETAYEAMRKNAYETLEQSDFEGYKNGMGRRALTSYLKYGYIPLEDSVKEAFHKQEQVSRTLEYAYDDFVLAQVAKKLNKPEADDLFKRAGNYKNIIDPVTKWGRGRYADGSFIEPFDPTVKSFFITEGTPLHYSWYVPHDQKGLIDLMGGEDIYIARLDSMFTQGYYWHGNEPGHQIPFLFNYGGKPSLSQKYTRKIMQEEYSTGPGGLCGNEDAGQMSAWYLFASMGFYPVCPGTGEYVIGSPLFEKVEINLPNGKKFVVVANNNSKENIYIQSAMLDGQPYEKNYITHADILAGKTLTLDMGPEPNLMWGSKLEDRPYSMSQTIDK